MYRTLSCVAVAGMLFGCGSGGDSASVTGQTPINQTPPYNDQAPTNSGEAPPSNPQAPGVECSSATVGDYLEAMAAVACPLAASCAGEEVNFWADICEQARVCLLGDPQCDVTSADIPDMCPQDLADCFGALAPLFGCDPDNAPDPPAGYTLPAVCEPLIEVEVQVEQSEPTPTPAGG